jgi:MoaA/NifB/PqqE/SkfB family radical SAM enzyme
MTYAERSEQFDIRHESNSDSPKMRTDRAILSELIKVLSPHPSGLRRWSVMRAIRKEREAASRDIPQKFEDEIERTFRRYRAESENAKTRNCAPENELFYRPKDKAGEVWAVIPGRAETLL